MYQKNVACERKKKSNPNVWIAFTLSSLTTLKFSVPLRMILEIKKNTEFALLCSL